MSLKEYKQKRNFDSTKEPKPKKVSSKNKRFVIQYHKARANHYDFRLEHNGVLVSFAVPKGLPKSPKEKRLAVHVEDHPVDYINFEGIIPKNNYGAGSVEIYDKGYYLSKKSFSNSLKQGHITVILNGEKTKGEFNLIKTSDNNWIIIKANDQFAQNPTEKTKLPFDSHKCQLATLTNDIPKGKNWMFEIKYDGYRILSFVENDKVKLVTRNNNDYTSKFSKIQNVLLKIKEDNFVLDGEMVSFDENGRSDFGLLQSNLKKNVQNFTYVVFDLLALNGQDLTNLPLIERKKKLELLLARTSQDIMFSNHILGKGKQVFTFAKQNNLEGIIAKKVNSVYSGTRNEDWLKIKCYKRQEFVIVGYLTSSKNEILSAILVAYYSGNNLIYAGKVGTGFSDKTKDELAKMLNKIKVDSLNLKNDVKHKNITYVQPKLIAEVQFAEITKDGYLRQASFVGMRTDKNPKDVKLEEINE